MLKAAEGAGGRRRFASPFTTCARCAGTGGAGATRAPHHPRCSCAPLEGAWNHAACCGGGIHALSCALRLPAVACPSTATLLALPSSCPLQKTCRRSLFTARHLDGWRGLLLHFYAAWRHAPWRHSIGSLLLAARFGCWRSRYLLVPRLLRCHGINRSAIALVVARSLFSRHPSGDFYAAAFSLHGGLAAASRAGFSANAVACSRAACRLLTSGTMHGVRGAFTAFHSRSGILPAAEGRWEADDAGALYRLCVPLLLQTALPLEQGIVA